MSHIPGHNLSLPWGLTVSGQLLSSPPHPSCPSACCRCLDGYIDTSLVPLLDVQPELP